MTRVVFCGGLEDGADSINAVTQVGEIHSCELRQFFNTRGDCGEIGPGIFQNLLELHVGFLRAHDVQINERTIRGVEIQERYSHSTFDFGAKAIEDDMGDFGLHTKRPVMIR